MVRSQSHKILYCCSNKLFTVYCLLVASLLVGLHRNVDVFAGCTDGLDGIDQSALFKSARVKRIRRNLVVQIFDFVFKAPTTTNNHTIAFM